MTGEEKKKLILKGEVPESVQGTRLYKTLTAVLSYIGCIAVAFGVMYFLDGTAGVILIAALVCAFVISLVMTLAVKHSMTVAVETDKTVMTKDEDMTLKVSLSKSLIIPSPLIEIRVSCSPHLELTGGELFKGAVAGNETNRIKIPLRSKHSGLAQLNIDSILLTDFLGLFSFSIKIPEELRRLKVGIYPNIPDAAPQTELLKTTNRFNSDDDEEESDENSLTPTGLPGYDHRQYFPGDPIKRINWKLSSKRDIYMIRLDEQIRGSGQLFFLDCPDYPETEYVLKVRDTVIEGALAMFTMLLREGREATFFFCTEGLWLSEEIHNMADVYRLQEELAGFVPCEPPQLFPPEIAGSSKTPICFTSATGDKAGSAMQIAAQSPDALIICAESAGMQTISTNIWKISDEFEFRRQQD